MKLRDLKRAGVVLCALGVTVVSGGMLGGCSGGNGSFNLNNSPGGGGGGAVVNSFGGAVTGLGAGLSGIFDLDILEDNSIQGELVITGTPASQATRVVVLPAGTYTFTGQLTGNSFTGQGSSAGPPAVSYDISGTLPSGGNSGSWTITGAIGGTPFTLSGSFRDVPAAAIPASMQGTYNLTFHQFGSAGGPVANGTQTQFVLTADTLSFDGKTLSNPIFRSGNTLEWIFRDGNFEYAASIAVNNGLNEINIAGPGGQPFFGQYNDR